MWWVNEIFKFGTAQKIYVEGGGGRLAGEYPELQKSWRGVSRLVNSLGVPYLHQKCGKLKHTTHLKIRGKVSRFAPNAKGRGCPDLHQNAEEGVSRFGE